MKTIKRPPLTRKALFDHCERECVETINMASGTSPTSRAYARGMLGALRDIQREFGPVRKKSS